MQGSAEVVMPLTRTVQACVSTGHLPLQSKQDGVHNPARRAHSVPILGHLTAHRERVCQSESDSQGVPSNESETDSSPHACRIDGPR